MPKAKNVKRGVNISLSLTARCLPLVEIEPRREAKPVHSNSRPRTPEVVRPEVLSRERKRSGEM